MNMLIQQVYKIINESLKTTWVLLKIMIPISIIIKLLTEFQLIEKIGIFFGPLMEFVGLPGETGIVWVTAMITNIYGGLIVFFSLSQTDYFTVGEVTILGVMILIAHTLPIELRISQKAGINPIFLLFFRVSCALALGFILNSIFSTFNILSQQNSMLWNPGSNESSIYFWILKELKNYAMIYLIILFLIFLMTFLKKIGIIARLNNFLEPYLRFLGMSKNVAPITIIGTTLGLSYGGALIINEAQKTHLSKKDIFLSISLMSLTHSLLEDTILIAAIGASLVGILAGRILFTILIMLILTRLINSFSQKTFNKLFTV
jgi:hypothetical protein